jgi:hypothetical protein
MDDLRTPSAAPAPACALGALSPAERRRRERLVGVIDAAAERVELPDGWALRWDADAPLGRLGEWIALERRCCPFLRFELAVAPARGPTWLRLTGSSAVKEFLTQALRNGGAGGRDADPGRSRGSRR